MPHMSRALAIASAFFLCKPLDAQSPPAVHSLGWPKLWEPYASATALIGRNVSGIDGSVIAGVHRPLMNPVSGLLGLSGEAYGTLTGPQSGFGARALAGIPALGLRIGADWNIRLGEIDPLFNFQAAIFRGGLLGGGSSLRLDWLPTRGRTFAVGLNVPLMQPSAGRTRARRIPARVPRATNVSWPARDVPATAGTVVAEVDRTASRLGLYATVYKPESVRRYLASPGITYDSTHHAYTAAVERAFGIAGGTAQQTRSIARRARQGALAHVLVPFAAIFGQSRDRSDLRGYTSKAQNTFERWLRDSSDVGSSAWPVLLAVHARWLEAIEKTHAELANEAVDGRAIWLPLQLALAPDELDEQSEIDSLFTATIGRPFSDGNALTYLRSSELPLEIARSIYAAREYHVLWMHDFTGRRETGSIDDIGFSMVADAYFPALTDAVKRYDTTGRLPVYLILLDQFFSASRDGQMWMDILQDPLHANLHLPGDDGRREAHLRARQDSLKAAVARSFTLTQTANASGGKRWLRERVKVHVTVTNPSDFSFRSHLTVPSLIFTPDNIVRDHRKIAFYDLVDTDPYQGAMLLMGVGVGEHYASATWEDRGYRMRGPAALEARDAARRVLEQHGFREEQIPAPLRTVTDTNVERRSDRGDYVGRALQVHNETGAGPKHSSIARALMYTLAPPGSVIIATDPLWLSAEWTGMLAAAAARGVRVQIIAPALANAPSPQAPLMALMHQTLSRVLELQRELARPIRATGGELRLGIFAAAGGVDDVTTRVREIRDGLAREPWILETIPFDAQVLAALDQVVRSAARGADQIRIARDEAPRAPQLHQKTQLVARPGAIATLVRQPGWEDVLARAIRTQSGESVRFADQIGWTTPAVEQSAVRRTDSILQGFERALPEADRRRLSFYFSVGTQNHDPRGLMLDGEASVVTSGVHAAAGLADLFHVMARSHWVTSRSELERYLPPPSWLMMAVARLVRPAL
jgi:hypothetical protein